MSMVQVAAAPYGPLSRAVPRYFLYGEMPRQAEPGFVHVESLRLRSDAHGWAIAPHLHDGLAQAFWVAEGCGKIQMETQLLAFTGPALLVIPAATAHGFAFQPDSKGWVLTLAAAFIAGLPGLETGRGFAAPMVGSLTAAEAASHDLELVFSRIRDELEFSAPAMTVAVAALVQLLMVAIHRLRPADSNGPSAGEALWQAFRAEVEQRFRASHSVAELAANLPVTRGRLDAICRRNGGRTAQQVIHDRLVLEAQRSLIYTGQSISAVAYDLGFVDPAYFSRFFVRETTETPGGFRRRHRSQA